MLPLRDNIRLSRLPLVTIALVLANVVAYVLFIRHGGSVLGGPSEGVAVHYGAIPYELTHPGRHCGLATVVEGQRSASFVACQPASSAAGAAPGDQPPPWATVITSMFLHGGFLHIFFNMLFLGIFGPTVEDRIGRLRYPLLYSLGGVVALAAQVLADPSSTAPTLGASGAIAAVLGGYLVLYPRARVLALVLLPFFATIVALPALLVLGFWFLEQLYLATAGLAQPAGGGGIAYFAHVGGFLFGLAAIRPLARRRRSAPPGPVY